MGEIVEGVIHGKTIELAVDPGLQEGGVVEVVNRGSNNRERGALLIFCFLEIPDTPIKG
jgi:DnaJ-class molecular chaperone